MSIPQRGTGTNERFHCFCVLAKRSSFEYTEKRGGDLSPDPPSAVELLRRTGA
ncbi:MAG: hypothetical protein H6Q53_106 [Deltaproteobacteria bacterium]|nr:hypothetical protein [Deltaproteobacteria bacterium]